MDMIAGDKRIQAFDPVDGPSLNKLCQGPLGLKRRAQPVITKRIQNVIGACRFSVRLKIVINKCLAACAFHDGLLRCEPGLRAGCRFWAIKVKPAVPAAQCLPHLWRDARPCPEPTHPDVRHASAGDPSALTITMR